MAITLSGQILAGYIATPLSTIIIGLFATLIGYVVAFFQDVSRLFSTADNILSRKKFIDNDFRETLTELVKLHNWTIS